MTRVELDPLVVAARTAPTAPAVLGATERMTYAQLASSVDTLASRLLEQGMEPACRIGMLLRDDVPAVTLIHAVRRIGGVLVPLNRRASARELTAQLEAAAVDLLIHDTDHAELAAATDPGERGEPAVSGSGALSRSGRVTIESLTEGATPSHGHQPLRDEIDLDAVATILFTSGTTGRAKGALLTHANHLASADAWAERLRPHPRDRWLACLPLFHVGGLAIVMRASRWGLPVEVQARFDPGAVERSLASGISHLSLVATQLEQLIDERAGRPVPDTLGAILLGGGPAPPALLARAHAAGLPVIVTYGMTETASGIAASAGSSQGRREPTTLEPPALEPLRGVELRVRPDDGQILVRGPMVFAGYLEHETGGEEPSSEAGRAAVDPEGWFATGDLGRLDATGRLIVAERRDDLFISGGENVYPAEIEAVLTAHPAVMEAAVVGRADRQWGAVPVAAIVVTRGAAVDDAELAAHCRESLAGYKVPVAFRYVDDLPRNPAGKLIRAELRSTFEEGPRDS